MKKNVLAILLAIAMMLAMFAGCGSTASSAAPAEESTAAVSSVEEAPAEEPAPAETAEAEVVSAEESIVEEPVFEIPEVEYPLTDTPTSFTLWFSFPGDLSDIMEEYLGGGKNSVLQSVEAKTGVKLEFMLQSVMTASDSFNLMVAAGDYPDMFQNASSYYSGGLDKAVEDEVLMDLTDMTPQLAPNYYAHIIADDATYAGVTTPTGKIVEINRLEADYTKPSTGLVIRQDWLDDLGLDTPVTLDDFHDVLTAFKNEKGAIEPLGLGYIGISDGDEILSAFDVNGTYAAFMGAYPVYVVEDEVKFGWVQDGFRDYLELMNQWYNEGLIAPDYYAENTGHGIDYSKTTTGQVGIWLHDYFQIELLESMMADPNADIRAIPAPVKEEGQTLHMGSKKTLVGGNGWTITTDCSDPELALQYTDYYFTQEGSTLCNYGVEGEGMEYDADGNPQYTEMVYANPDHSMRETQVMYTLTVGPFIEVETRGDIAYPEKAIEARDIWGSNQDDAYSMPTTEMNADQASEVSGLLGDIMTYASGKITEFIIGSDSLDNWDAYIQQMESFGIDRVTEIYQEVYDAYVG